MKVPVIMNISSKKMIPLKNRKTRNILNFEQGRKNSPYKTLEGFQKNKLIIASSPPRHHQSNKVNMTADAIQTQESTSEYSIPFM